MSSWDFVFAMSLTAFPLLLIILAVLDWRRTKRRRYLGLLSLHLLFGLALVTSFASPNQDAFWNCALSLIVLMITSIIHISFRRQDASSRIPTAKNNETV